MAAIKLSSLTYDARKKLSAVTVRAYGHTLDELIQHSSEEDVEKFVGLILDFAREIQRSPIGI